MTIHATTAAPRAALALVSLLMACGSGGGTVVADGAASDSDGDGSVTQDTGAETAVGPDAPDGNDTATSDRIVLRGASLPGAATGATVDLVIADGAIVAVAPTSAEAVRAGDAIVDLSGRWLAPGFIDSHVHLAFQPAGPELLANGVVAAVDHAAPVDAFMRDDGALTVVNAGPMVTAVSGYPTQSWGRNGYGREVASPEEARVAVAEHVALGAGLIKVPVTTTPTLDDPSLAAAIEAAHDAGLQVSTHALSDAAAARAAAFGADVLAHTPVAALADTTVDAWADRAVISTLEAFGGQDSAVANLRALHERGATVMYGTDLGNSRYAGIDPDELTLLASAGLSAPEILAAGTSIPAAYWGLSRLGTLEAGKAASFLVLDADPHADIQTLARPVAVWVDGVALPR